MPYVTDRSLLSSSAEHKDRNPAISVPPSRALGELVRHEIRLRQHPVWRVASLAAPRLGWGYDPDHAARFRRDAWSYMETASGLVWKQLTPRGLRQLLDLQAATKRDVWGETYEQIAQRGRYSDPRAARRAVKRGRLLWAGLPVWPWSCFDPEALDGGMPRRWWELPELRAALGAWLDS